MSEVLLSYYNNHGKYIRSAPNLKIHCALWTDFFEDQSIDEVTKVTNQESFHRWLRASGKSEAYIQKIINCGKAAINRAWKRGEISTQPFVLNVSVPKAPPKGRPLSISEVQSLLDEAGTKHLKRFILLMLGTCCRPEAVFDLDMSQIDFTDKLIDLNPADREQTKKYRPIVKLPLELEKAINWPKDGHVVNWRGEKISSIKTSWRKLRKRCGFGNTVCPYSLRHTMARWLRSQGVNAWQVSAQLGHRKEGMSTTEIYASYDPAYLDEATEAINAYFKGLRVSCV